MFNANINGFSVVISIHLSVYSHDSQKYEHFYDSYEELLSDPINAPIAPFFSDGEERTEAFRQIISAIDNRKSIGK